PPLVQLNSDDSAQRIGVGRIVVHVDESRSLDERRRFIQQILSAHCQPESVRLPCGCHCSDVQASDYIAGSPRSDLRIAENDVVDVVIYVVGRYAHSPARGIPPHIHAPSPFDRVAYRADQVRRHGAALERGLYLSYRSCADGREECTRTEMLLECSGDVEPFLLHYERVLLPEVNDVANSRWAGTQKVHVLLTRGDCGVDELLRLVVAAEKGDERAIDVKTCKRTWIEGRRDDSILIANAVVRCT